MDTKRLIVEQGNCKKFVGTRSAAEVSPPNDLGAFPVEKRFTMAYDNGYYRKLSALWFGRFLVEVLDSG